MPVKVVALSDTTPKPCTGFTMEIKIVPKKDLRVHVIIDKTCVKNEPLWAFLFELERKIDGTWTEIVFVSFIPKADDPKVQEGIRKMFADKKMSKEQIAIAKDELIPATAPVEGTSGPTPAQSKQIEAVARKIAVVHVGG